MLLFSKRIIITKHAKKRYIERIARHEMNERELRKAILSDFQIKKVRRKTRKKEDGSFSLWCFGAREYACIEKSKTIIIKTVIQKMPKDEKRLMRKDNRLN